MTENKRGLRTWLHNRYRTISLYDFVPPPVAEGQEYRLPSHVIPELAALATIRDQRKNEGPYLTGIYDIDKNLPTSPAVKRIIESGLFSARISFRGKNRKGKDHSMDMVWFDRAKELRNVSTGVLLQLVLSVQRARESGGEVAIGLVQSNRAKQEKVIRKRSKKARLERVPWIKKKDIIHELSRAKRKETRLLSKDVGKVLWQLHVLPKTHPLRRMRDNLMRMARKQVDWTRSPKFFIVRGINTAEMVLRQTADMILVKAKEQGIALSPEEVVSAFEASVDVPRTMANMNLGQFVLSQNGLETPWELYNSRYFSLVPVGQGKTYKLVFSPEGLQLLATDKQDFLQSKRAMGFIATTTRCPARQDGDAKVDDFIIHLHKRIVRRARTRVTKKAS